MGRNVCSVAPSLCPNKEGGCQQCWSVRSKPTSRKEAGHRRHCESYREIDIIYPPQVKTSRQVGRLQAPSRHTQAQAHVQMGL